jgi:pantothenate kinase-related protein Tda10
MPQVPFHRNSSLISLNIAEALFQLVSKSQELSCSNKPTLISIGGPGGTGKSTLAKKVSDKATQLRLGEFSTIFCCHP